MHNPPLPVVAPGTSMLETIGIMNKGRLGTAIVVSDNQVMGIITDGDLRRAMAQGESFFTQTCDDIMTITPVTIDQEERFATAEKIMLEKKINSLVVVDAEQQLCGILQIYDL